MGRKHTSRHAIRTVGVFPVVAAMMFVLAPASALAQDGSARGIDRACGAEAQRANPFTDVRPGQTHQGAINCLWVYGVVQGHNVGGERVYLPDDNVTRQQMASYIARLLMLLKVDDQLPNVGAEPRFADSGQIASPHIRNVNLLHEIGVAQGFADGTYGPTLSITRAQMASFIARAIEEVTGEQLPRANLFGDVSGVHRANIEKLAAIGVVEGRASGVFTPDRPTSRAQMASFMARTMDYLVEQGVLNLEDGQGPLPPGTVRWEMDEPAGATRMRPVGGVGPSGDIGSRVRPGTQVLGAIAYRFPNVSHEPPARPEHLVTVPDDPRFNPGSGHFRVTLRLRTTTTDDFNIVQKGQWNTTGGMWKLEMLGNGRMECLFRGSDGSTRAARSTTVVNDGQWHVVSCLRTSGSVTMWVDGVRTERRDGPTGTISNDWELSIGGKSRCNQTSVDCDYFVGDIDWIEITKGQ